MPAELDVAGDTDIFGWIVHHQAAADIKLLKIFVP